MYYCYSSQSCIKFVFLGQHWTGLSIGKFKKKTFLVCSIKISISVLNFSTVSVHQLGNQQFTTWYSSLLDSPKNGNAHPSEMKNYHLSSPLTITEVFPGLEPILTTGLKYWLTVKLLQISFYLLQISFYFQTVLWK